MTPVFSSLNCLASAVLSPDVSLPRQNVTSPFAFSIDAGSIAFAPSVEPASSDAGAAAAAAALVVVTACGDAAHQRSAGHQRRKS